MTDIFVGDVASCRRSFLLVVSIMRGDAILCPFVGASELRHRADLDLRWVDLADAHLTVPDMRLRAIPCRKRLGSLTRIGTVRPSLLALAKQKMIEEINQNDSFGLRRNGYETIRTARIKSQGPLTSPR
ncbi:hypothetical protein [Asaia sp. HN010]|uniref:hypothetical protein n=1 Tax=Asaia sp. HN010 TaxID=3081233 RepID=UPI003017FF13